MSTQMRKYFGTDGIRGRVGQTPMTPQFVMQFGMALGKTLRRHGSRPLVVIGKDTRLSGYMLESALEAGLASSGVDVLLLGPMPTPAVAYLTQTFRAQSGAVISASHNPFFDNGIKLFGGDGYKLSDAIEAEIEVELDREQDCVEPEYFGRARRVDDAAGRYIEFCKSTFRSGALKGMRLVLDCANGASYHVTPHVLRELGADVEVIGAQPDGININAACGSTSPAALQQAVKDSAADAGIALDGDADRCLMVDAAGQLVDGDEMLYVVAQSRRQRGRLRGPVVGTLMSNLGLELALRRDGIDFKRAQVGDRYVLELMQQHDAVLGGESSGHMICLDRCTTGDGTVAALQVLAEMSRTGQELRDLLAGMDKLPQQMINVRLPAGMRASALMQATEIQQAVRELEAQLGDSGRILLRPSGTEPLIRVMAEGREAGQIEAVVTQLADTVKQHIGESVEL